VLLIDEGQKLSTPFLEILRTLLNYETNEYKLLQLVLVSQMELLPRIKKIKNFYDRIALKYIINPLDEEEAKEMIEFRLAEAGLEGTKKIFTDEAIERIFEYTQGYPRKTSIVCHNALEALVMHDKSIVDSALVSKIIDRESI
jgi:general secretion pathway protein A